MILSSITWIAKSERSEAVGRILTGSHDDKAILTACVLGPRHYVDANSAAVLALAVGGAVGRGG